MKIRFFISPMFLGRSIPIIFLILNVQPSDRAFSLLSSSSNPQNPNSLFFSFLWRSTQTLKVASDGQNYLFAPVAFAQKFPINRFLFLSFLGLPKRPKHFFSLCTSLIFTF